MKITLWGTRGSLPSPGHATARYGGNTSCVEVRSNDGSVLVLDAGSGIRSLGGTMMSDSGRIDLLLSHLHMDHIQGLGFFAPFYMPGREIHVWGPPSTTMHLTERLALYLSPPLFPVRIRELDCKLEFHDIPLGDFNIGPFKLKANLVCHPSPTLGFRISENSSSFTYLPDHEPALGCDKFPDLPEWTSGFELAKDADLMVHDTQYIDEEYPKKVGWGHSSVSQSVAFAKATGVKHLIAFHHDPSRTDEAVDKMIAEARAIDSSFIIEGGAEGATYQI